jgi:hypothetical protein
MTRLVSVRALALAALLFGGCAFDTVRQESSPVLTQRNAPVVTRVAIVPFGVRGDLARRGPENTTATTQDVVKTVTRFVSEELSKRGVQLVPADDVAAALANAQVDPAVPTDRRPIAQLASHAFGADGILMGEVMRYRDRTGQSLAAASPASVGFTVSLYDAPGGRRLWSGTFEETQQALTENIFNARRYPGGGTRWLTAEELAKWGAQEISKTLPVSVGY